MTPLPQRLPTEHERNTLGVDEHLARALRLVRQLSAKTRRTNSSRPHDPAQSRDEVAHAVTCLNSPRSTQSSQRKNRSFVFLCALCELCGEYTHFTPVLQAACRGFWRRRPSQTDRSGRVARHTRGSRSRTGRWKSARASVRAGAGAYRRAAG